MARLLGADDWLVSAKFQLTYLTYWAIDLLCWALWVALACSRPGGRVDVLERSDALLLLVGLLFVTRFMFTHDRALALLGVSYAEGEARLLAAFPDIAADWECKAYVAAAPPTVGEVERKLGRVGPNCGPTLGL